MQPLDVEGSHSLQQNPNLNKIPFFTGESQVLFITFTACLGFLSIGYHLSVPNSSAIYIWLGCSWVHTFHNFRQVCDAAMALTAFLVCGIFAFNKIKFPYYRRLLIIADLLMIIGTLATFTLFSTDYTWILFGRIITGLGIGVNLAYILPYVREVQFYLSESSFKIEKRRFFVEVFFSFGVFLGYLPSQLPLGIGEYGDYNEVEKIPVHGAHMNKGEQSKTPETWVCVILALIPLIASVARIVLLAYNGEVKPPQYAPVFNDEGLCDDYGEEDTGKLSMIKFKETKSLFKLLREPYRRRIELCYILHFLQVVAGFVIFIVNPQYVANYIKNNSFLEDTVSRDAQTQILIFGAIFLVMNILGSLTFTVAKIPRRVVLGIGNFLGIVCALVLIFMSLFGTYSKIKFFLYFYWACTCVGMGPATELIIEEVIPGKGLQFLFSIKWLLIGVIGLLTRISLRFQMTYIPLYFFFLTITIMSAFVVYDLLPETAGVHPNEIYKLFEYVEDEHEGTVEMIRNEIGALGHEHTLPSNKDLPTRSGSASSHV